MIGKVLDQTAQHVLKLVAQSKIAARFYLAGGTGLALQIGHRKSLDIDFFQIERALSIRGAYPFPLIYPLVSGEDLDPGLKGLSLASPKEIALMKAYAMGRRPLFRDYVDLYCLLKGGLVSLEMK